MKNSEIDAEIQAKPIYTVGHSNHSIEEFLELLKKNKITAVADVRSMPYSRIQSHFNRDKLKYILHHEHIKYLFMGKELGGRPSGSEYYRDETVDYEKVAKGEEFRNGIERLLNGRENYNIVLLCSEKDPINCHRMLLIGRELTKLEVLVKHILYDGNIETHKEAEERLMKASGIGQTLFDSDSNDRELVEEAYKKRSSIVAYSKSSNETNKALVKEDEEEYSEFITIYTIGFTKKTAHQFFETLRRNNVKKLIDTRLKNISQMAGFTKKRDLEYFCKVILNIEYVHMPALAPTDEILRAYQKKEITWNEYEVKYHNLISERHVENLISPKEINHSCMLCSEAKPDHCHRRLLVEYLKSKWSNVVIKHL